MPCACREARGLHWFLKLLKRGKIKEIITDEYVYGDVFGPIICYFRGHDPVMVNENDPECQMIVCKVCHRKLS